MKSRLSYTPMISKQERKKIRFNTECKCNPHLKNYKQKIKELTTLHVERMPFQRVLLCIRDLCILVYNE